MTMHLFHNQWHCFGPMNNDYAIMTWTMTMLFGTRIKLKLLERRRCEGLCSWRLWFCPSRLWGLWLRGEGGRRRGPSPSSEGLAFGEVIALRKHRQLSLRRLSKVLGIFTCPNTMNELQSLCNIVTGITSNADNVNIPLFFPFVIITVKTKNRANNPDKHPVDRWVRTVFSFLAFSKQFLSDCSCSFLAFPN